MTTAPARRRISLASMGALLLLAACTTPEPVRTAATPATTSPTTSTATRMPAATGATGGTSATEVIIPPSPTGTRYNYTCAEGKTFAILAYPAAQERVTLFIDGKTLELKQERHGSGTRHSDGATTLIAKGVDAFIEQGGVQTYRDCKASRP